MSCSRCASHKSVIRTIHPQRSGSRRSKRQVANDRVAVHEQKLPTRSNTIPSSPLPSTGPSFTLPLHDDDTTDCASRPMAPSQSVANALADAGTNTVQYPRATDVPRVFPQRYPPTVDPSRYPSLIAGSDTQSDDDRLPSPYSFQLDDEINTTGSTFLFMAPGASSLPSILLVPPTEGDVSMPIRLFVDDSNDWTYTIPDPFLLAPPAQTSSGRVLHPLEYDTMQASSDGQHSPFLPRTQDVPHTPYVSEDTLSGCAVIPSAFEDEEQEDKLIRGSTSVVEVYVRGGVLCERPAAKLYILPEVMYTRPPSHAPCDPYETDDDDKDDDWEVVTPDTTTSFGGFGGSGVEALYYDGTCEHLALCQEKEGALANGCARSRARSMKYVAAAARGFVTKWRV